MPVGIVHSVDGKKVEVVFSNEDACASCHGKSLCHNNCNRIFDFESEESVAVGDRVHVDISGSSFLIIAVLCYGIPLLIMAVSLFCLHFIITVEWILGIVVLLICGLWFVLLRALQSKIRLRVSCKKM